MRGHLTARMVFLLAGALVGAGLTSVASPWPLRPAPAPTARLNPAEHAAWGGLRRTETRLCLALNSVYGTAAVWVTVGGAWLVTRTHR